MLKKLSSILIIFFFCIGTVYCSELKLTSDKYILYNMNDDRVLLEKNSNEKTNIASLTKIMTVLIAIENTDNYDKKVTITDEMLSDIEWDVSVSGFKSGETVTFNDLLYGAMLPSGADAANSLAYSTAGSMTKFIKMMNDKVNELNLKNTNFANVTGLYDKDNYSSAYDVAEILKYALKNSKFKEVFQTRTYTSTNNIKMRNTLLSYNNGKYDVSYITGSKTGYIPEAGRCLATTATLNKVNFLLVTLNSYESTSSHVKDAVDTYTYFDENYKYQNIVDTDDVIVTLNTKYAHEKTINIYSNESKEYYLKNDFDKEKDITYDYDGVDEVSYFTKKGTTLGKVNIMYNGKSIGNFELIYNATLSFSLLSFLWINKVYVIVIIIFITVLILSKNKTRKKKKN